MLGTAGGQRADSSAVLGSEARAQCRPSQGSCVRAAAAAQDVSCNAELQLAQGGMFS